MKARIGRGGAALEFSLLRHLYEILRVRLDLREVCEGILIFVKEGFDPENCSIMLMDSKARAMKIKAAAGAGEPGIQWYAEGFETGAVSLEKGAAGLAAKNGTQVLITDADKDKRFNPSPLSSPIKVRSLICIPLKGKDTTIGVLNLSSSQRRTFTSKESRILSDLAPYMSDALWRAYLLEVQEEERRRLDQEIQERQVKLRSQAERLTESRRQYRQKISELKRLAERLIEVRIFHESLLQSIRSGLMAVDREGKISYMNRGAEEILSCSAEAAKGKRLEEVVKIEESKPLFPESEEYSESSLGRETVILRPDGKKIPIGFTISMHRDQDGREIGRIINFRDLTLINKMQEEIMRMDRLASLGEVSMGIAHEIRNPLAGIRITAQAMEEEIGDDPSKKEYVTRIINEIDRLNELLKSFFSFAKPKAPQLSYCQIQEMVREVTMLLQKELRDRKIILLEDYGGRLPPLKVDFNQIKQVLLNLFLNAIQAMPQGGELRIACFVMDEYADKGCKGSRFHIIISDTGRGIPEENIGRIFDPFFTTKAKGLGLGLSISYRIIQRHGGSISVESKPGEGTAFHIVLPVDSDLQAV